MQNERCVLKMKKCHECGAIVNDREIECSSCGAPFPIELSGAPRQDNKGSVPAVAPKTEKGRFCKNCGEPLPFSGGICPACSASNLIAAEPPKHGEARSEVYSSAPPKDKKSKLWLLLLLLPTALLGLYLIAVDNDIIYGGYLMESGFGKVLGVVCFFILPIIFFVLLAAKVGTSDDDENEYDSSDSNASWSGMFSPSQNMSAAPASNVSNAEAPNMAVKAAEAPAPEDKPAEDGEEVGSLSSYPHLEELEKYYGYKNRTESKAENESERLISLEALVEDMVGFAASKGVYLTEQTVRSMVAAVAADRLIIAEDKNGTAASIGFYIMAEYFGGTLNPMQVPDECSAAAELARGRKNAETVFLRDVYTACLDSRAIRFAFLSQVVPSAAKGYLSEYVNAIAHRNKEMYATVERVRSGVKLKHLEQGKVTVAKNLKLVVSPVSGHDSSVIAKEKVILDMSDVSSCPKTEYTRKLKTATAWQFSETVRIMRESKYLSEDTWKKIDKLFEYLGEKLGCSFDNRDIRIMETYSSAYLAAGGSATEALDSMLAACVMRALYEQKVVPEVDENGDALVQVIEGLFDVGTLPICVDLARRLMTSSAVEALGVAETEAEAAVKGISLKKAEETVGSPAEEVVGGAVEEMVEAESEEAGGAADMETETEAVENLSSVSENDESKNTFEEGSAGTV